MSEEVLWGKYSIYEGPWHHGTERFALPANPSLDDQILATITATEGGRWNAVNFYDTCICTVGLIQWCEGGQFSVSSMLGKGVEAGGPGFLDPLRSAMEASGVDFKKNGKGQWRFFSKDGSEVDSKDKQRKVFLLRSNGQKGTWDAESKEHAKRWVLGFVELYKGALAIKTQHDFTAARLRLFAAGPAAAVVARAEKNGSPGAKAFVCGFLSFAANNPAWARDSLAKALASTSAPEFSNQWLADVFEDLTWAPNVSIYPIRYNKIRPLLESQFGVDLPDLAADLRGFAPAGVALSAEEIQDTLVKLGFDLGSSGPKRNGVDGAWGHRSTAALLAFERQNGFKADGKPDPEVNAALVRARAQVK